MKISELVDIDAFRELCENFTALTGLVTAVLDLEGNIIIATGWQDICTRFHRVHPLTAQRCRESDTILAGQMEEKDLYIIYRCKNGLIDVAARITIGDEHIGNFFTGQFFLELPDVNFFIHQAEEFGFDKDTYLDALSRVPIINENYLRTAMRFFYRLAHLIGEMGNAKKRLEEANVELHINRGLLEKQVKERTAELTEANKAMQVEITDRKRMEEALQKAHDELEIRVRERTIELMLANEALQAEISERKHAKAVLQESEEKYRQFFKTSQDFIFVTSKEGRIIDMNDAALELFGFNSFEELREVKVPDLYVEPEEREKLYSTVLECGYAKEFPADLHRTDGSTRKTLITAVGQYDTNGILTGLRGTIRDITEQRRNEEELSNYRKKLEIMVVERTNELEEKTKSLQEVNTALNVLLQKREDDKKILEERFVVNISRLVIPYLEKIKKGDLDEQQLFCMDVIKKHLDEIASPLLRTIQQFDLTSREIEVASLIKDGKTTKEIAEILRIGKGSVNTHRNSIRKKLRLGRTSNLYTRLRVLEK